MKWFPATLALLAAFAAAGSAAGAARDLPGAPAKPVVLPNVRVDGHPWTSFGLSFAVLGNPKTHRVTHLIIWRVAENSEADFKGVKPGDQIVEADGEAVTALTLDLNQTHSRFRDLFINRRPGDRIRLKILEPHAKKPFALDLTEAGPRSDLPSWASRRR